MRTTHDSSRRGGLRRVHRIGSYGLWLAMAAALVGCGDIQPVAPYSPITDPAALFVSLTLDHGAINLSTAAPYNELQLTATPRNGNGAPMEGLPAPTFRSTDTTKVWVTPDGLLQAREPGTEVRVIAEIVADGNVRHADTALVNVTSDATPPMLDVLSIEPTGDEPVWPMVAAQSTVGQLLFLLANGRSFQPTFTVRALDAESNSISDLLMEYEALEPEIADIHPTTGHVTLLRPGNARIVVRTTAYGVSKEDTAEFTVTLPVINGIMIQPGVGEDAPPTVSSQSLMVRPGGYVFWTNLTSDSVSVTFDDPASAAKIDELCTALGPAYPAHCDSGNIPPFMSDHNSFYDHTRGRRFMEPGTYTFHIEPLGVTGQVIVTETLP